MRARKNTKVVTFEPLTLDKEQAKARYNLGENSLNKIAAAAGAYIKVCRRKLYLRKAMDTYFENLAQTQQEM